MLALLFEVARASDIGYTLFADYLNVLITTRNVRRLWSVESCFFYVQIGKMWPQSGRHGVYDPHDTWDQYTGKTKPHVPKPVEKPAIVYASDPPASEEALVKAFANSNASQALREDVPFDDGRKMLRMQRKDLEHQAYNQNILPMSGTRPEHTIDEFFVGGTLGVEDRFKAGTMVDRLGNEFEVWESQIPPPDKDYSSIAPSSSQRHLERCQGADPKFYDRPKREVSDKINPAEPRGDGFYKRERSEVAELKGRSTFFNQAGLQPPASFDTTRTQYDGYNVRTDYKNQVVPVEPCWRASLSKDATKGAEPIVSGASVRSRASSKKTEVGNAFQRAPNRTSTVSANVARITLPYVAAASLRSQQMSESKGVRSAHSAVEARRSGETIDHTLKSDAVNPQDEARGLLGPVQFTNSLTDTEARDHIQRDNEHLVKPVPTRSWDLVKQFAADVDHMAGDDAEISHIQHQVALRAETTSAPTREDVDRATNDELSLPTSGPRAGDTLATRARPDAELGADASWEVDHGTRRVTVPAVSAAHARVEDVTRVGGDVKPVDDTRHAHDVNARAAESDTTRQGRAGTVNTHVVDRQPVAAGAVLHGKARADASDARNVETNGAPLSVVAGDAVRGAPMVNEERRYVESQIDVGRAMSGTSQRSFVAPVSQETPTNRSTATTAAPSYSHKAIGVPISGQTDAVVVPQLVHMHYGGSTRSEAGMRVAHNSDDRPEATRNTSASQHPNNPVGHTNQAMRAMPSASVGSAGTVKHAWMETGGATHAAARAVISQKNNDRSTPTRALTPGLSPTAARWTPTLQVESNRETAGAVRK